LFDYRRLEQKQNISQGGSLRSDGPAIKTSACTHPRRDTGKHTVALAQLSSLPTLSPHRARAADHPLGAGCIERRVATLGPLHQLRT